MRTHSFAYAVTSCLAEPHGVSLSITNGIPVHLSFGVAHAHAVAVAHAHSERECVANSNSIAVSDFACTDAQPDSNVFAFPDSCPDAAAGYGSSPR